MNRNRICPECETEYLPHIEKCADCGAVLLLHEEHIRAREKKKALSEQAVKNGVGVREGDLKWIDELYNVLLNSGVPCTVITDVSCNKSCCGDKCKLIVAAEDAERAQARIEEYFVEMHPEIQASNELISEGKCPACGSPVKDDDTECIDCGLTLIIIEEDIQE